jgi:mRNA-degrading endonuclease RelE of RelBE toxin-antitoxin system
MKRKVTLDDQPLQFIRRQPPETRARLREALHKLEDERLFPIALHDELDGFYKLRVDRFRFILHHVEFHDGPGFHVIYAEARSVVYELLKRSLGMN